MTEQPDATPTPFADVDAYIALPRTSSLLLSPAGDRLVTSVATLDQDRTRYVSSLWEVDPRGLRAARRLTHSDKGGTAVAFLPDGGLLFTSARPGAGEDDEAPPSLWLLPAGGGEARVVAVRPGGISGAAVARDEGTVVLASATLPGATGSEDDERRRKARKDLKVSAILHEQYPIRFWDTDLGPEQVRLLAGRVPAEPPPATDDGVVGRVALTDLTRAPGRALDEAQYDISPDGGTVVTTWQAPEPGGRRITLAAIDVATGDWRVLLDDPEEEYGAPSFSPDGLRVAVLVERRSTPRTPPRVHLAVLDLAVGERTDVALDWDRWPAAPRWAPDGEALIVTADDLGRSPVFRIGLPDGDVTRLTGDDAAYTDVRVSPDGQWVYALRAAVDVPPAPVRLDARRADQEPERLPAPARDPVLPGALVEITATADDGSPLRAWLALPHGASAHAPAPLLLWVHGGPLLSWNAWQWRWNPWIMAARGYAVLLPDPALSTGYGQEFVRRGWGRWGQEPYTDLMTITDAAVARPDVDADRTAVMGGSFGGYMANWIAGHTDRFRAIVTHAGLWALDQFAPTTDTYHYWRREMTPAMSLENSPHRFVAEIRTPMLVIHGDKDYRVPIGEALRLWAQLAEQAGAGVMPHKFLCFPDENHWVLKPQHAKLWYQVVEAFLDTTVHGKDWQVPDLLR
ncbi:MAG TPA: S9 family peptidase [Kineosporiaceae bacterium]|nr:S9 family peptidase [Kineosporiaceae bacterium]